MRRGKLGLLVLIAGAGLMQTRAQLFDDLAAGPFAAEFSTIWETGRRAEALGTLAVWEDVGDTQRWGLSPLLSYERTPILKRESFDLFYPVLTWRRSGTEYRWQFVQLFNFIGSDTQAQDGVVRRTVFPLYFEQTSRSGTNDYFAVMPFYGHLENRLFRDEIEFIMFPFYAKTRKGERITRNYLYPFVSTREGAGWSGWKVWPLYATERKEITWVTNTVSERVISPGREKWFALWPVAVMEKTGIGTTNEATTRAVLPFYSTLRSEARDQTSILWPFFSRTEDRQRQYVEWGAPWPLLGWADGPGKTARRVFPFYGKINAGEMNQEFVLWPVFTHRSIDAETLRRDQWRSVYFFYSDIRLINKETGEFRRDRGMWPFFVWRHELDGRVRLQVPAPLETVLRNREAVQRNYSPLWAMYRAESNPKTGAASQSVLWNLFRREVTTNAVRTSCLFGLVQTKRIGAERHWRFFWLPNRHFAEPNPPRPTVVVSRANPMVKRGDVLRERQLTLNGPSAPSTP
ncbi:MAG TPA: hypothetical protein PLX89_06930 [Verrucomicrobiota bacterium]|nr:hypothetical protein [Verrucomicrobiales bacterium]HRI12725.1 hypothetical protein [Verrucomicrobiota bacterium]